MRASPSTPENGRKLTIGGILVVLPAGVWWLYRTSRRRGSLGSHS